MNQIKTSIIALAIATIASNTATATEDLDAQNKHSQTYEELPEYIVVAHTYEVPRAEVGSTVEIIDRQDLEVGQTTLLLDAFRELPGVAVRNNGGAGNSFGITTRGLKSTRPVILLDGIEVSNPADGNILNPGLLFSNSIERVEFLKGPQSALYGANTLAGVINIQTRDTQEDGSSGSISGGIGSFNTRQGALDYQFGKGPFELSFSLNSLTSDGFSSQDNDNEDDGYENTSALLKLGYQLNEDLKLYALTYYIDAESEFDNTYSYLGVLYPDTSGLNESEQFFAKTGAIYQVNDSWETKIGFAYTDVENITSGTFYSISSEGVRQKLDWSNVIEINEKWTVATGLEHELEENETYSAEVDTTSLYIDNTFELLPGLHWTLGGRVDDNSDYGSNETWRTTLSYQIAPINSRLHGSYGTSFIAPTLYERFHPLFGTPGLVPEEGDGWDLGLEVSTANDTVILDVTLFGNKIDDKINFSGNVAAGTFLNRPYESKGVESSIAWEVNKQLLVRASYTYSDADEEGEQAVRVPEHLANLSVIWNTWDEKLDLKTSVIYTGKQLNADFSANFPYPNVELDAYTTVNVAGQYQLTEHATLWTSINNILDEDYQEILGYNSPGFNMTAGIRIEF